MTNADELRLSEPLSESPGLRFGLRAEKSRLRREEESVKNMMFPNCVSLGVPGQQEGQMAHSESSEQSPLHDAGQAVRELLNGTGTNQYG